MQMLFGAALKMRWMNKKCSWVIVPICEVAIHQLVPTNKPDQNIDMNDQAPRGLSFVNTFVKCSAGPWSGTVATLLPSGMTGTSKCKSTYTEYTAYRSALFVGYILHSIHCQATIKPIQYIQGCAKKLVPSCEKSYFQLQPAPTGDARLVLSKTVTFSAQLCTCI